MRRAVAAIVLPLILVTAGCGGEPESTTEKPADGTIADVTVTGDFGAAPTVDFRAPMTFATTESSTVIEGPGEGSTITPNANITVDYLGINASTGETFDSTWPDDGTATPATFRLSDVIVALGTGLEGAQAGDRVLITAASEDGFDPVGNGTTVREGDSLVLVVDVHKVEIPTVVPTSALPTLTFDEDGDPSGFKARPSTPDSVGLLTVEVVTEGTGAAVKATDTITARYLGQVWPDGAVFDENYSAKKPAEFGLDAVIPGWQQGLVGQKVGSRVILAIPSDLAYGASGYGEDIPPNADLIFVVDIVKAAAK